MHPPEVKQNIEEKEVFEVTMVRGDNCKTSVTTVSLLSLTFQIVRRDYPMIHYSAPYKSVTYKCQSTQTQNCVENAIVNRNASKKNKKIHQIKLWYTYQHEVIPTLYVENFEL